MERQRSTANAVAKWLTEHSRTSKAEIRTELEATGSAKGDLFELLVLHDNVQCKMFRLTQSQRIKLFDDNVNNIVMSDDEKIAMGCVAGSKDYGIDLCTVEPSVAIQAKCYKPGNVIPNNKIVTFLAETHMFAHRVLVTLDSTPLDKSLRLKRDSNVFTHVTYTLDELVSIAEGVLGKAYSQYTGPSNRIMSALKLSHHEPLAPSIKRMIPEDNTISLQLAPASGTSSNSNPAPSGAGSDEFVLLNCIGNLHYTVVYLTETRTLRLPSMGEVCACDGMNSLTLQPWDGGPGVRRGVVHMPQMGRFHPASGGGHLTAINTLVTYSNKWSIPEHCVEVYPMFQDKTRGVSIPNMTIESVHNEDHKFVMYLCNVVLGRDHTEVENIKVPDNCRMYTTPSISKYLYMISENNSVHGLLPGEHREVFSTYRNNMVCYLGKNVNQTSLFVSWIETYKVKIITYAHMEREYNALVQRLQMQGKELKLPKKWCCFRH